MSKEQKEQRISDIKERANKTNNTVRCELCRDNFSQSDINKIVSMGMLFTLKQHLHKRGIFKFEYLERFRGYQLSCKVCDICYALVVAEHELIEIEKSFGRALNIPIRNISDPPKKPITFTEEISKNMEERKINIDLFKDKLMQWRLLFFIKRLRDISLKELSSEAKNDRLYLHLKIFDFITSIKIYDKNKTKSASPKKSTNTDSGKAISLATTPRYKLSK